MERGGQVEEAIFQSILHALGGPAPSGGASALTFGRPRITFVGPGGSGGAPFWAGGPFARFPGLAGFPGTAAGAGAGSEARDPDLELALALSMEQPQR